MNLENQLSHNLTPDLEISCRVLKDILEASGKRFVCPLCRTSHSQSHLIFGHCRDEADKKKDDMSDEEKRKCDLHKALGSVTMGGDFRQFRESLATACGQYRREIPVDELPLDWTKSGRRSYGSCLGTEFIVKNMATSTATRFEILRSLVKNAGIHYACPSCWTGFAKSEHVTEHCDAERDNIHRGLLSKEVKNFVKLYGKLLGQKLDWAHMKEVEFDGNMVPDFRECFRIDNILGHLSKCWYSLRCKFT
jgi:hypothetical protein